MKRLLNISIILLCITILTSCQTFKRKPEEPPQRAPVNMTPTIIEMPPTPTTEESEPAQSPQETIPTSSEPTSNVIPVGKQVMPIKQEDVPPLKKKIIPLNPNSSEAGSSLPNTE